MSTRLMQNLQTKEPDKYEKIFTQILHEAQKHWSEIEYDPVAKTARGALVNGDRLIVAVLSFDDSENHLTLTTRLPVKRELNMPAMLQVLRYQNHHRNLCSFLIVDDECSIASIEANTRVYENELSLYVAGIFKDTYTLLKDEELNELLN